MIKKNIQDLYDKLLNLIKKLDVLQEKVQTSSIDENSIEIYEKTIKEEMNDIEDLWSYKRLHLRFYSLTEYDIYNNLEKLTYDNLSQEKLKKYEELKSDLYLSMLKADGVKDNKDNAYKDAIASLCRFTSQENDISQITGVVFKEWLNNNSEVDFFITSYDVIDKNEISEDMKIVQASYFSLEKALKSNNEKSIKEATENCKLSLKNLANELLNKANNYMDSEDVKNISEEMKINNRNIINQLEEALESDDFLVWFDAIEASRGLALFRKGTAYPENGINPSESSNQELMTNKNSNSQSENNSQSDSLQLKPNTSSSNNEQSNNQDAVSNKTTQNSQTNTGIIPDTIFASGLSAAGFLAVGNSVYRIRKKHE